MRPKIVIKSLDRAPALDVLYDIEPEKDWHKFVQLMDYRAIDDAVFDYAAVVLVAIADLDRGDILDLQFETKYRADADAWKAARSAARINLDATDANADWTKQSLDLWLPDRQGRGGHRRSHLGGRWNATAANKALESSGLDFFETRGSGWTINTAACHGVGHARGHLYTHFTCIIAPSTTITRRAARASDFASTSRARTRSTSRGCTSGGTSKGKRAAHACFHVGSNRGSTEGTAPGRAAADD